MHRISKNILDSNKKFFKYVFDIFNTRPEFRNDWKIERLNENKKIINISLDKNLVAIFLQKLFLFKYILSLSIIELYCKFFQKSYQNVEILVMIYPIES